MFKPHLAYQFYEFAYLLYKIKYLLHLVGIFKRILHLVYDD